MCLNTSDLFLRPNLNCYKSFYICRVDFFVLNQCQIRVDLFNITDKVIVRRGGGKRCQCYERRRVKG